MTMVLGGQRAVYLGCPAWIVEDDREVAWAEKFVRKHPGIKWVLGKFVEADKANQNGHIFDLKELETAQQTIQHSPLNLLHRPHAIVGSFVGSELIYPVEATAGVEEPLNPYVEALASFW